MLQNARPIRPSRRLEPFDSDEYLYELKIDGFRALAHIANRKDEFIGAMEMCSGELPRSRPGSLII